MHGSTTLSLHGQFLILLGSVLNLYIGHMRQNQAIIFYLYGHDVPPLWSISTLIVLLFCKNQQFIPYLIHLLRNPWTFVPNDVII
jgi:hypothetical protein